MLNQRLQQKLQQKLSPQQIQLMKLLQVPTVALEQRIKQEIEENPALEEGADDEEERNDEESDELDDDLDLDEADEIEEPEDKKEDISLSDYLDDDEDDTPYYKLNANNTSPDDERREIPFSVGITSQEYLIDQLGMRNLTPRENTIAQNIIGNLDDSGYLQRELSSIVNDIAFSQNIETTVAELERLLKEVQELDPPGIGARNLQECLLIQLERKPQHSKPIKLAVVILKEYFNEFIKKHYDKIEKRLGATDEELKDAIHEILKLNPKPGDSASDTQKTNQYIMPDFILFSNNGKIEVSVNSRNYPDLKVNRTYMHMLEELAADKKQNSEKKKEAIQFVKQKIDSAKWFIDALKQRNDTLLGTMQCILEYQRDYFLSGDETKLKPMILKDIADVVKLDISTISRVVNSKYIQTPFGTFLLKTFFSESLSTDAGEEVSTREVKKILEDCIGGEDKKKPLTDDKLMKILTSKGYNIARRTVAKYREQLNIPVARLRKEM